MKYFIFLFTLSAFSKPLIVIDPGHGGDEVGATSSIDIEGKKVKIYEKNLTLKLALILEKELKSKFDIILTRRTDIYKSLEHRAKMASVNKADLFLSIHFNSSTSKSIRGAEIFYLDNHKDKAIKKIERIENRIHYSENKEIDKILVDLAIQFTSKESKMLAQKIEKYLKSKTYSKYALKNRGSKGGLFYVLALAQVPSLLLEIGFMSNQKELSTVRSTHFMENYSKSISLGIQDYLRVKKM